MAYATQSDLVAVYGEMDLIQLTDTTNMPPSTIDAGRVEIALRDASGKINAYLASRFSIPLTPVPDEIRRTCVDIAWYYLHARSVPEGVERLYDRAIKFLIAVSDGTATLAGVTPPGAGGGSEILFEAPAAVFDHDRLAGY